MQSNLSLKESGLLVILPLLILQLPCSSLLPLGTLSHHPPRMSPFHTPATQSDFKVPKLVLLLTGPFHHLSPLCRIWTHHTPHTRSNSSLALGAQLALPQPLLPSHVQDRFPRTQCLSHHSIRVPGGRHTHLSPADCEPVKMGTCWYGSLLQPSIQHPLSASVLGVCRMNKLGLEAWI